MTRWRCNLLAAASGFSMEPSAEASDRAAPFEAAPNRRSVSLETVSIKTTPLKATSLKPASLKSVLKAATVGPAVIRTSPAVPGTSADKDPVREPARTVVTVGRATIRIVRVITIRADRRASHIAAEANPTPTLTSACEYASGNASNASSAIYLRYFMVNPLFVPLGDSWLRFAE